MRGRKPKPTELHALHGNPSNLKQGVFDARRSIDPPDNRLDAPDDMTQPQRDIWTDALASAPPGILRRIDTMALRVWVIACDLHRQATALQARTPLLVHASAKTDADGKNHSPLVQSPFLAIINRQGVMMLRAAEQLGFTPTSRPRLYGSGPSPMAHDAPAGSRVPSASLDDYLASAPPPPIH